MPKTKMPKKSSEGNTGASDEKPKIPIGKWANWCFTLFSPEPPLFDTEEMKYLAYGHEICPVTKREHWQGYVSFLNQKRFTEVKKYFGDGRHFEAMMGSFKDNETYCSKESKLIEFGTKDQQGKRVDIEVNRDHIMSGDVTSEQIMIVNPKHWHQYGRTYDRIQNLKYRTNFRTEMTQGISLFGDTGVGKSHAVMWNYHPDTHYIYNYEKAEWWDGYKQQPIVVFNEYRGQIPFSRMLDLCDKWPINVPRRYDGPIPFTSKYIIITGPVPLAYTYRESLSTIDGSIKQLERRFVEYDLNKTKDKTFKLNLDINKG